MLDREVVIESSGRCGYIWYSEGPLRICFDWEFGGTCLVVIWTKALRDLRDSGSVTADRAREILNFVAQHAVAQKAPGHAFEIDEEQCGITILLALSPASG